MLFRSGPRAVAGWCWRAVASGTLRTSADEGVAAATIRLTRHSRAARRFVTARTTATAADGSFRVVVPLAAPRRGTAAWLLREARLWSVDAGVATARVIAR